MTDTLSRIVEENQVTPMASSENKNTMSRRSFLGLVVGATALTVFERFSLGSSLEREGSISQRTKAFKKILSELAAAKVQGGEEKIETSEKVLYLWTLCNVLEMGARFHFKYDLAANNMRHFLYGDGSPIDLSERLELYLKENQDITGKKNDQELGIRALISKAIYEQYGRSGQKIRLSDPNYPERLMDFVYKQGVESQRSPLVLGAGLNLSDFKHERNWHYGVGNSIYKLKYAIDKDWHQIDYAEGGKVEQLGLRVKSYDVSFTDIYDWDSTEFNISPVGYYNQFINSLGIGGNKERDSLGRLIRKIEEKYYSKGQPEKEFDLLARNGYAHSFDMSGHASDSNLSLELSFPVAEV